MLSFKDLQMLRNVVSRCRSWKVTKCDLVVASTRTLAKMLLETTVHAQCRQIENASPTTDTFFFTFSTNLLYPCMYTRGESQGASSGPKPCGGNYSEVSKVARTTLPETRAVGTFSNRTEMSDGDRLACGIVWILFWLDHIQVSVLHSPSSREVPIVLLNQPNVARNPKLCRPKLSILASFYCNQKFFKEVKIKIIERKVIRNTCGFVCL